MPPGGSGPQAAESGSKGASRNLFSKKKGI
jgi:hypothetical protein